jgi:hypothetical protein
MCPVFFISRCFQKTCCVLNGRAPQPSHKPALRVRLSVSSPRPRTHAITPVGFTLLSFTQILLRIALKSKIEESVLK